MQLSRRWLDWQPSRGSSIPHTEQLTKLTKPLIREPRSDALESCVNSVSQLQRSRVSSLPTQKTYAVDGCPIPALPPGVKLVRWEPLPAPVRINRCMTVTNTERFIESTVGQLGARLKGDDWGAGNWSCTELLARLEAVGCVVALDDPRRLLQ